MLLVDDILLFPIKGVLWILNEVCEAVDQELDNEADAITVKLQQLYAMLEAGKITEIEFDEQEGILLDRLDAIQERGAFIEGEDEWEEEGEDEWEEEGEDE
jgi:hypothetical protein